MTRIHTPKFEREQELADAMGRGKSRGSKGGMNKLMRGMKDDRDEQTEARQAKFFVKKEEPDTPAIAKAREEAEATRLAADEAARSLARRT
jgi:hypothetical protein